MLHKPKKSAFSPMLHPIRFIIRRIMKEIINLPMEILITDEYGENLWEAFAATYKTGLNTALENELRAEKGAAIDRPLGSPRKFPSLDDLMFSIAQLYVMPEEFESAVDTSVVIGKKAKKPFTIDIPIIVAPMAYGTALSKGVKIAMAKASTKAGTAATSGEGPLLKEEREAAKYYIHQYNRGDWSKSEEELNMSDAIEIQFGQGAIGGVGSRTKTDIIDDEMYRAFRYPPGHDLVAHSRQPEVQSAKDLVKLVKKLKDMTNGIPIGAKIGAGKYLEADLNILCNAGVDFICVDSCEAGTRGSVPILQDDFGVPAPFAIARTGQWLEKNNFKDRVTFLASGKIRAPGDMLKACALGADACYVGNAALFTVSHIQAFKTLPYEPVTQLVWHNGQFQDEFDIEQGAAFLSNYLISCKQELDKGIQALGKNKLQDVNKEDLSSLSELISKGCGVPMAYQPYEYEEKFQEPTKLRKVRKITKMDKSDE